MWTLLFTTLAACDKGSASPQGSALCNVDADGDGYGTTETTNATSCDDDGVSDNHDDCDDLDAATYPGGTEIPADGLDQDCDGTDLCFDDVDLDGYGDPAATVAAAECKGTGVSASGDDCDDLDPDFHPGAQDIPVDGIDQNCDGGDACFLDADGDGFGVSTAVDNTDLDCTDAGEAANDQDCLDSGDDAAATFPGAAAHDSDTACMTDADGDGYGAVEPAIGVTPGHDCDDHDSTKICTSIHIGNDVEFTDTENIPPDRLLGSRLTVDKAMTVTHLALIGKDTGANVRMALYADDGPEALVVEASSTAVAAGVVEIPVTPTELTPGYYWIMAVYDRTASVGSRNLGPGGPVYLYCHADFEDPLPDPFGDISPGEAKIFNYYIAGY